MRILVQSKRATLLALALAASGTACSDAPFVPVDSTPALDARLRQAIAPWGVVPILPVNAPDPALVSLGKMLFFDKVLSGNRDVSCASCHSPASHTGDDASLDDVFAAFAGSTMTDDGSFRDISRRRHTASRLG